MKWLKYLLLTLFLMGATVSEIEAQKIRFPTNVRYIGGGYAFSKTPYFATLEGALNNVKAFATSGNPYVFWVASDSLWISDWDSVFTASGLTMKDSIDVYYVATGKIKWGGFGFGGTGGGGTPISTPSNTTTHYDLWTWTGQDGITIWQTRIGMDMDSIDERIWELVVYTDSVYLYIENDTLRFRQASISITGWNPDTTTVIRTTGNQSKSGSLTMTAGILFGVNGYLQLPAADYGPGNNIWRTSDGIWFSTGVDTFQILMVDSNEGILNIDSLITWNNLNAKVKDSLSVGGIATFTTTDTVDYVVVTGLTSSDVVTVCPIYAATTVSIDAQDFLIAIPITDTLWVKREAAGTSGLKWSWIWNRKETD